MKEPGALIVTISKVCRLALLVKSTWLSLSKTSRTRPHFPPYFVPLQPRLTLPRLRNETKPQSEKRGGEVQCVS